MAQVSARRDPIANELFQFLHLWKPAHFRTGPDRIAVNANLEHAARNSQLGQKTEILAALFNEIIIECLIAKPDEATRSSHGLKPSRAA